MEVHSISRRSRCAWTTSTGKRLPGSIVQHMAETGQVFTAEALALAWQLTLGQPWLVNALGYEACFRRPGRDRSQPITGPSIERPKRI